MMASGPSRTPIVEFLGQDAGAGGPFALLGLPHHIKSNEQVLRACTRRLHQIDRHRHRSTPDAAEVRLAVHTAASQLLDPNLREELARRWPEGTPVSVPQAWKPMKRASRLSPGFLRNAKLLIAASGGWNATARKRLTHLARVNRVGALELVQSLNPPAQTHPDAIEQTQSSTGSVPKLAERVLLVDPPPRNSAHWFLAYMLVVAMGAMVALTIMLMPKITHSEESTRSARADHETPGGSGDTELHAGHERDDFAHYTAIAHELEQLVGRVGVDQSGSIERLKKVYPLFVDGWESFPEPALKRVGFNISEFVIRSTKDDEFIREVALIFACTDAQATPAQLMIRAATIDVVLSDPNIHPQMAQELTAIRTQCAGSNARPDADITAALVTIAGLMAVDTSSDDPRWWTSWLGAVRSVTENDPDQQTRLVLSAMSARLRDQSPPGEHWAQSSIELASAVHWREGSPERYWLLSQFADQAVSTPRLASLTQAIANYSKTKQITAQMVLNPSATFSQRQQLAEQYRSAWGQEQATRSTTTTTRFDELINELHVRVSITPIRLDETQALKAITELGRLNSAAWLIGAGEEALSEEMLASASERVENTPEPMVLRLDVNRRDTQWAEQAINAASASDLSVLFAQLVQDDGPGANSAYALVYLVTTHSDSEMRSLAITQIVRYKDHPSILLALDQAIGSSRISSRLDDLVTRIVDVPLPARTHESWYPIAHQALLDQFASSLARTIETTRAVLEAELGAAYAIRAGLGDATNPPPATQSARQVYQQLLMLVNAQATGRSYTVEDIARIEASTRVRLARAQSDMHRFLAYQRAICELLARRTDQDIPGSTLRVRDLLSELESRLDQSTAVLEQIAQAERCIAQLWILRLEGDHP